MQQSRLSRGAQKRVEYISSGLDTALFLIGKLDEDTITEIVRRASIPSRPDGLPRSTALGEKGSGGDPFTSSTEGAAFARNPDWNEQGERPRPHRDPIQRLSENLERGVGDVVNTLRNLVGKIEVMDLQEAKHKERPTTSPCAVCEASAEKAGYCRPHYDNWCDYGKPDRLVWEMWKRQDMEGDVLRVPECPKPSSGNKARRGPWKTR